jgi:RNA polymerase sigma factor (sigma-70 family)
MTVSRCQAHRASASSSTRTSTSGHHLRNRALLQRLGRSRACAARLHWRNALVVSNLALVRLVANRESRRSGRPFDELYASGCLGLIRAVEGFDASRGLALSSFAVPYIRGAMLQEQRDREQPLHTPRRLRELQRRAEKLVEQRRGGGLTALSAAELAGALGCSLERLEEAGRVKRALVVGSLDQPTAGSGGEGGEGDDGPSRLDLLSAGQRPWQAQNPDQQHQWLMAQLGRLSPGDRDLLEGRWIDGLSWRDLGRLQGCSAAVCRERGEALLVTLQTRAPGSTPAPASTTAQASIASRAAMAV